MSTDTPPSGAEYLSDRTGGATVLPAGAAGGDAVGATRRRTHGRVLALGVSAALVVGIGVGGVYAGQQLSGGGDQPAARVPADAFGYLAVDLDPAAGQKIQALRFLRAAPAVGERIGDTDDLRRVVFDLLNQAGLPTELSFEDDIEPWLGDRAAIAALPPAEADASGTDPDAGGMMFASAQPQILVVLQVTDEGAARTSLEAAVGDQGAGSAGGFVVADGWALISTSKGAAEGAARAAAAASLADDPQFRADTAALGERGIATGWMDLEAFGAITLAGLDSAGTGSGFEPAEPAEPAAAPAPPAAPSATATAEGVRPPEPSALPAPPGPVLTDAEFEELGTLFERQAEGTLTPTEQARLDELSARLSIADPLAEEEPPLDEGAYLEDMRKQIEAGYVGRYAGTLRFDGDALELVARATGQQPSPSLAGQGSVDLASLPGSTVGALGLVNGGTLVQESWDAGGVPLGGPFGPLSSYTGLGFSLDGGALELPDDLVALLGEEAVIAIDSAGLAQDEPAVGARLRTDGAAAEAALGRLQEQFPEIGALVTRRTDEGLVASTTHAHADALSGSPATPLGDGERYREVLGDAGDAELAFFLDLGALGEALDERDLAAWGAIGGWGTSDGEGTSELTVRLTTG